MRLYLIFVLCLFGFKSNAHEMTPAYPVLNSSYINGVVVAKMKLFNRRQDVDYYQIDVFTEDWNPVSFATTDKLLKVGGYIEFDDYEWTIGTSPTCSPYPPTNNKQYEEHFTKEQIDTSHVKLIVDNLVKTNNCYLEIKKNRIYQKIK